jgi:hypothetical protein
MLLIGLILNKFRFFIIPITLWMCILVIQQQIIPIITIRQVDTSTLGGYGAKRNIMKHIIADNKTNMSAVMVYSSAIYTYDYDYLFQSFPNIEYLIQTKNTVPSSTVVYLIIPETEKAFEEDFVNNNTPPEQFNTVKMWQFPDKTKVYKRMRQQQ